MPGLHSPARREAGRRAAKREPVPHERGQHRDPGIEKVRRRKPGRKVFEEARGAIVALKAGQQVGSRDQLHDLVKKRSGDIWLRLRCPEFGV
jgi:hypothetical protein